MKRTNLTLDEDLLYEAKSLYKAKTLSEAVNKALETAIKSIKVRKIQDYKGSAIWQGDLSSVREDS